MHDTWEQRIADAWADDALDDDGRIAVIDALSAERGEDARALFERAGARDSAGREEQAESLYRRALALGLDDEHRPQAVIQLASTLRNLERVDEAVALLREEYERHPDSGYRDAAAAFYALALASAGEPKQGLAIALKALVPYLPRYHRSVTAYADELADGIR